MVYARTEPLLYYTSAAPECSPCPLCMYSYTFAATHSTDGSQNECGACPGESPCPRAQFTIYQKIEIHTTCLCPRMQLYIFQRGTGRESCTHSLHCCPLFKNRATQCIFTYTLHFKGCMSSLPSPLARWIAFFLHLPIAGRRNVAAYTKMPRRAAER